MLADWRHTKARLAEVETRMVEILDQLDLTELVTSIPGVSAVGAAAILAETGDPTGSIARGRWSNTPGYAHGRTAAAPPPAGRGSPGGAGLGCD